MDTDDAKVPLKPCPFCGSTDVMDMPTEGELKLHFIGCRNENCEVDGPARATSDEAAEAWNNREA